MSRVSTDPPRRPRCPRCRAEVGWTGNPHRPFCSLSCRLIDLGVWLDERYRLAGEPLPLDPSSDDRETAGAG